MNFQYDGLLIAESIAYSGAAQDFAQGLFGRMTAGHARRGKRTHRVIGNHDLKARSLLKGEQDCFESAGGNVECKSAAVPGPWHRRRVALYLRRCYDSLPGNRPRAFPSCRWQRSSTSDHVASLFLRASDSLTSQRRSFCESGNLSCNPGRA